MIFVIVSKILQKIVIKNNSKLLKGLKATFCTCCASAEAKSRSDGSSCYLWTFLQVCFCPPVTQLYVHYKFRSSYNIKGNICLDCVETCCFPCSVSRMLRESEFRGLAARNNMMD
jgi:Cys-rich protein (TIGR01571 family)